ncbi:MASE1 domain-containing protein [Bordetella genomosp. 11]|nr:MASE1 domain-containing protein [Bordetella genomosp. 11]
MTHRRVLCLLIFSLGYVCLAAISMRERDAATLSTLFWPPAGVLMAALMLNPARRWAGWMALAALLHIATGMLIGQRTLPVALVFALTDLVFCATVAALWRWRTRGVASLNTLPATLWFIVLLSAGSVAGGVLAVLGLRAADPSASAEHWYVWSLAGFVGCLITTPMIVAWAHFRPRALAEQNVLHLWIGLVAAFALLAGTTIVFDNPPGGTRIVWHDGFGMSYGPLLFVAIVALAWGALGSTLIVAGLALVAGSYTLSGMGPYANIAHFDGEPLLAVQGFLGCAALLSLVTSALSSDREQALKRTAALTRQLEAALRVSGQVAWEYRRAEQRLHWLGQLPQGIPVSDASIALTDWLANVHEDDRDKARAWLHTGADSYAQRRLRVRIQGPDGGFHVIEMTGSAISQVPDRMTGLAGAAADDAHY